MVAASLPGGGGRGAGGVATGARSVVCAVVGFVTLALWLAIATGASASGWAVQRTPNPAGATYGQFAGVSCPSLRFCTAVGFLTNGADIEVTLAERRHGTRWSIQQTPNPGSARSSGLNGVSCLSLRSCTAVGFFTDRAGTLATLAERWNGNSWSIQRTSNPIDGALVGVSCASTTACTALGSNAGATLAERWNGTSWAIQRTPNPADAISSQLDGVSCASPRSCTAVGTFTNLAGINMTLAERYS